MICPSGGPGSSIIAFGADQITASTTPRFLYPWYSNDVAQTSVLTMTIPTVGGGTLRNMRVRQENPAGNGNPIVYTLRVNGVASLLTVSILSTAQDGSDLVNTVAVVAGDEIDLRVTKAAVIAASPMDILVTMEYLAT
jgi:hypothetical protein